MSKRNHKTINNYKYFNLKNTKNNSFLVVRGRYVNDLCNIIGSMVLNQVYHSDVIIISDLKKKKFNDLFSFFGLKNIIYIFSYKKLHENILLFFKSFFLSVYFLFKIKINGLNWLINSFRLHDIKIGDLIYDTYTRYKHRYIDPKIDLYFFKILFESVFRFLKLISTLEKYKPKFILIGTDGYSYNDGILMRIGLSKKINTIEIQPKFLIQNKNYQTKYGRDHLKMACNFSININQNLINNHYSKKLKLKASSAYTDSYFVANKFTKSKKKLDFIYKKFDKIVLIAPHAFSDAPHTNGQLIFRDFYHQFIETLKFIKRNKFKKNILWIIKNHPANFLYDENYIFKDIISPYLSDKVIICPKNINTNYLIKYCDHVITTNGSIGMEFAAQGKKPILGGKSPYSNLGFTFDPKNQYQYFEAIKNIHNIKRLNKKQIFNAKKAIYILDKASYKYSLKESKILNFKKYNYSYNKGLLKNKFIANQKIFLNSSLRNLKDKKIFKDPYFLSIREYFETKIK